MLEIETEPLTEQSSSSRRQKDNAQQNPPSPSRFHFSSKWQKFIAVLVVACLVLFFWDTETAEENIEEGIYTETKTKSTGTVNTSPSSTSSGLGSSGVKASILGGDKLVQLVVEQKNKFENQLKADYGAENFQNIFYVQNNNGEWISRGRQAFGTPDRPSWSRMKRKFMIKILQAQIEMHKRRRRRSNILLREEEDQRGWRRRRQQLLTNKQDSDDYYAQFIWANGGHSSSAGHGNFYWETYTAVMERPMKNYFGALGIRFIGRNYAMGGTSSGEEIALCTESVFGADIDALSWDYGMTDAGRNEQWKQLLYTYHTAQMKNRPAAIGMEIGTDPTRTKIYEELAGLGMITFYRDARVYTAMQAAFPNTLGLTDAQIDEMPRYVRRFKCGEGIEKGDPGCSDDKYNMTACTSRKGFASWHPGWKIHALQGNTLALFLGEVLLDAAKELSQLPPSQDVSSLLKKYIGEEVDEYANVWNSPIPGMLSPVANWILGPGDEEKPFGNVNIRELYLKRSFCHTALLPAEIRYRGLLTQSSKVGFTSYDTGMPQPTAGDIPDNVDSGEIRLAYDPREHAQTCDYNTGIDFKDFFFLSTKDGWKTLIFPNDVEKSYYDVDPSRMIGMIIICLTGCDWNKCENGDLRDTFDQGHLSMEVNGVPVIEYTMVGRCWALKSEQNGYKWTPNFQGKYDIRAKVENEVYGYVRFGSFILV